MFKVEATETYPVKREQVWDAYTDHAGWRNWAFVSTSKLDKEGSPTKNGVGAVRILGSAGINSYEEVTLFQPYDRMEYGVVKGGLPFKGHKAIVLFQEVPQGTRIHWSCTFESKVFGIGWLMKLITQWVYSSTLKSFKKYPFASSAVTQAG